MRGLALNFASTHRTENPRGFSEVGENKQLLIAIVGISFLIQFHWFYTHNFHPFIYFQWFPLFICVNTINVIV
ncbi:MAG TPA: hypothetical protein EYO36_04515 [Mesonia sp.]|nr:hypothetical protein [Mesonia sp.]